jgi:hypothetical protein
VEGANPSYFAFAVGEARRRRGGIIEAAVMPPPECDDREGGAAPGGRSALGSPWGLRREAMLAIRAGGE